MSMQTLDELIKIFLETYGVVISGHEDSSIVDLMCDDHHIIEYCDMEYWVKENNILYTEEDEEILEHLLNLKYENT